MLIASPDNPQKPVINLGSTVWSTIPPASGQPATVAVKADADIRDLKMHATMTLRKNTDPTLQATHTIDLKFAFADGAPITGFKDVGAPQMRKIDSTASEALTSVKVKISDVYFLIALAKGDQDTARNLDLMQTRAWFDFPLLLDDNRIAKLVFQKSSEGDAMLAKAFEAWKSETPAAAPGQDPKTQQPQYQSPPDAPAGAPPLPLLSADTAATQSPLVGDNADTRYFTIVYSMIRSHLRAPSGQSATSPNRGGAIVFTVDAGGKLLRRKLVSPSGSPSLDTAVMTAIAEAAPYPAPPNRQPRSMRLTYGK
jgi:TonB family protein